MIMIYVIIFVKHLVSIHEFSPSLKRFDLSSLELDKVKARLNEEIMEYSFELIYAIFNRDE